MTNEQELVGDDTAAVLGVGDRLKAEREARGLSIDDVAQTLKVSRRVLDQVEANAWGQLPGHTFARGIVRGYAKFVHLDAEPLLTALESAPLPKPPLLELPQSTKTALPVAGQSHTRDRLAMIAGVCLVAIAVLAYFLVPEDWLSGRSGTAAPVVGVPAPVASSPITAAPPAVVAAPGGNADVPAAAPQPPATVAPIWSPVAVAPTPANAPAPAAPAIPSPATTPAAASPIPAIAAPAASASPASTKPLLVLRFDQVSWVEVRDRKGVMLLSENVPAGNERTVDGNAPLALALGNAEGVRVTFRGQPVDLKPHTRQKVARLSLE